MLQAKEKTSLWAQKRSKAIFEIYTALSRGLCGEKHYSNGMKLLPKSSGNERAWLVASLAGFHRRMRHKPVDGVKLLATEVLAPKEAKAWLAKLKKAESARKRKYFDAKLQARRNGKQPPEPPVGLAVSFPVGKLRVTSSTAPAVLELARCLGQLGQIQDGLYCINACGIHSSKGGDSFLLIQSHESLGDLNKTLTNYAKAKQSYQSALGIFKQLKKEAARYGEKANYSKWEQAVKARLQRKLSEINKLLDIKRYGPEFVAYRSAHSMELKTKDYVRAIELYNGIIEKYPKSVFSEASKAYSLRCYLEQSKRSRPRRGEDKVLAKLEKKLDSDKEFIKLAKRCKVPKAEFDRLQAGVDKLISKIDKIKQIPYGKEALARAQEISRTALRDNRFSLYRAEMLCLLGDFFLEHKLDQEKAFEYYSDAWKWLNEIKTYREAMSQFQVPDKAAQVSRPPVAEKKTTGWTGWIVKNNITPGQIVNRLTAPWYLNSLRARSGKMLSLCFFIQGKKDKALNAAKAVLAYEPLERKMYQEKRPNSYQRLLRAYNLGWFRCLPAELKLFRTKQRTAVILGDFYYEVEDYTKCENVRRNLVRKKYGTLTKEQTASALYRLAEACFILKNEKECRELLERIADQYQNCFSAADALIGLGNILSSGGKPENLQRSAELYTAAAKVAKDPLREKAMFYALISWKQLGERKKAEKVLRTLLAKYPKGRYHALAQKEKEVINNIEQ